MWVDDSWMQPFSVSHTPGWPLQTAVKVKVTGSIEMWVVSEFWMAFHSPTHSAAVRFRAWRFQISEARSRSSPSLHLALCSGRYRQAISERLRLDRGGNIRFQSGEALRLGTSIFLSFWDFSWPGSQETPLFPQMDPGWPGPQRKSRWRTSCRVGNAAWCRGIHQSCVFSAVKGLGMVCPAAACRSGSGLGYACVLRSVVLFLEAAFSAMEISEGCFNMLSLRGPGKGKGPYGRWDCDAKESEKKEEGGDSSVCTAGKKSHSLFSKRLIPTRQLPRYLTEGAARSHTPFALFDAALLPQKCRTSAPGRGMVMRQRHGYGYGNVEQPFFIHYRATYHLHHQQ